MPTTARTFADEFIEEMPRGFRFPDVVENSDGTVSLEWERDASWTASISFEGSGEASYSVALSAAAQQGQMRRVGDPEVREQERGALISLLVTYHAGL